MSKYKMPSRQKPKEVKPCTLFPRHEWEYVGESHGVRDGVAYHCGLYTCSCGAKKEGLVRS
jgi:hypothetical protein